MNSEHSAVSEDPTHDELIGHGGLEDLTGLNDCDFGELIFQHGRETCGTPDDAEERIHKVSAEDRHHTHEVFRQYTLQRRALSRSLPNELTLTCMRTERILPT